MAARELEEFIIWHFASAELDENRLELRVGGELVEVEARPMELLLLLLRHAGATVSSQQISDEVWPERKGHIGEKVISNNVHKLRSALGDVSHTIIQTVPRKGYRLLAEVTRRTIHKPSPEFVELEVGQFVRNRSQWKLIKRLAAGGYGEAWLAQHAGTGEQHVFKFSFRVQQSTALKREVTISRLLQKALPERAEFVPIIDWDFEQIPYFIESEFSGANLGEWSDAAGGLDKIPLSTRLSLITSVADAIGAAHAVGVLHLDLKPENILIENDEDGPGARICDFGAGRLVDRSALDQLKLTAMGLSRTVGADSTTGTAAYIAPEVYASGIRSERSDVYSLGVLLYQFVVGDLNRPIATGWESQIDDAALRDDIAQCTQGDPSRRLASAQLLADRLGSLEERRAQLESDRVERERATQNAELLVRIRARRPYSIAVLMILVAGISVTSYLYVKQRQEYERAANYMQFFMNDVPLAVLPPMGEGKDTTYLDALVASLPLARKRFEHDAPAEQMLLDRLLVAASTLNDPVAELPLVDRRIELSEKLFGPKSSATISDKMWKADVLYSMGKSKDGFAEMEKLATLIDPNERDASVYPVWLQLLSRVASADGRYQEAVDWRIKLVDFVRQYGKRFNYSSTYKLQYRTQLVADEVNDSEFPRAIEYGNSLLPELKEFFGQNAPYPLMLEASVAEAKARSVPDENTESSLRLVCRHVSKVLGEDSLDARDCWNHFAGYLEDSGRWDAALQVRKAEWDRESSTGYCSRLGFCVRMRILLSLDQIRLGNLVDGLKTCRVAIADAKENLTDSDRSLALGLYVETIGSSIAHQTDEAAVAYDQLKGLVESYRPYEKLWSGRESLAEAFTLSTKGDRSGSAVADSKARELLEAALGPRSSELTLSRLLSQADQKSRGKAR